MFEAPKVASLHSRPQPPVPLTSTFSACAPATRGDCARCRWLVVGAEAPWIVEGFNFWKGEADISKKMS